MATLDNFAKKAYYVLRPIIPIRTRWYLQKRVAGRVNGFDSQPTWPIPAEFAPVVDSLSWPGKKKTALVLTHDVDNAFGFSCIDEVCAVERRLGLRSSWNIVPSLYPLNDAVFGRLKDAGMEVGVHDWNHDGCLFSSKTIFDQRIGKINQTIEAWGAKGFRAGMVFHHDEWMQELACLYDSSYYDTDPYQPMGGGCGHIWPFMLGGLVELPYTMPQDHVLFVAEAKLKIPDSIESHDSDMQAILNWIKQFIDKHDTEMPCAIKIGYLSGIEIWKMKAHWLCENNGLVLMITHPDYLCHRSLFSNLKSGGENYCARMGWLGTNDYDVQAVRDCGIIKEIWHGSLLEQYAAFLNWFKREFQGQYWHCLPMEMANWYRSSQQSK